MFCRYPANDNCNSCHTIYFAYFSGMIWETWVCLRWFLFIFPMENPAFGESTCEYFLGPLKQIQGKIAKILYLDRAIANNECGIWQANTWVSEMVVMYPTILGDSTCNHGRVGMGRSLRYNIFFERKTICQLLWDSAGVWAFDPYPSSICSSWMYVTLKFPGLQLHQGTRGLPTSPSLKWFSQVCARRLDGHRRD